MLIFFSPEHQVLAGDEIEDTCNYVSVRDAIINIIEERHYGLVETLASTLVKRLMDAYGITWIRVEIRKFCVPDAESVGVQIEAGIHP